MIKEAKLIHFFLCYILVVSCSVRDYLFFSWCAENGISSLKSCCRKLSSKEVVFFIFHSIVMAFWVETNEWSMIFLRS